MNGLIGFECSSPLLEEYKFLSILEPWLRSSLATAHKPKGTMYMYHAFNEFSNNPMTF